MKGSVNGMKKVTLRDVAEKCGVSFSLVSKVLRNKYQDGSSISKEKADMVLKAAAEMGYVADKQAQKLRTGKGHTVAVLIPLHPGFGNSVYPELMMGIMAVASHSNYDFIFFHILDTEKEYHNLQEIVALNPDGIIYAVPPKHMSNDDTERTLALLNSLASKNMPIIFAMEQYDIPNSAIFRFDDFAGGYEGTKHLINKGYKKIGFCMSPFVERMNGYISAMTESHMNYNGLLYGMMHDSFVLPTGYRFFKDLYRQKYIKLPEAIFATCDIHAIGIIRAMSELGLKPQEDIYILGYDGLPLTDIVETPFESVVQPVNQIGSDCAESIIKWIETGVKPDDKTYLPTIKTTREPIE